MANEPLLADRRLASTSREARTRHGLTQAELAIRVGMSRKTIDMVKNDLFVPSVLPALSLAAVLEPIKALFSIRTEGIFRSPGFTSTAPACCSNEYLYPIG